MVKNSSSSEVRKGAWTKDEDNLLTKCIHMYGEGKWHLVPFRAGLNRCRKSCRLRWMNYLRPNIKRGDFGFDEVALILRLHKLLGNRWSLIAGRIPGRTANDVKNYWNIYLQKKVKFKAPKVTVIKPQPRRFLNNNNNNTLSSSQTSTAIEKITTIFINDAHQQQFIQGYTAVAAPPPSENVQQNNSFMTATLPSGDRVEWWEDLFADYEEFNNDLLC